MLSPDSEWMIATLYFWLPESNQIKNCKKYQATAIFVIKFKKYVVIKNAYNYEKLYTNNISVVIFRAKTKINESSDIYGKLGQYHKNKLL